MKIVRRTRRALASMLLSGLAAVARTRPVPLAVVRAIRWLASSDDAMSLHCRPRNGPGAPPAGLAPFLEGVELGGWALGPGSLEQLVRMVVERRPRTVVEFGSGASTVALAWALAQVSTPTRASRLISIEQDADYAERTRALLGRANLGDQTMVLVAPLAEQAIEGRRTTCYVVPPELVAVLNTHKPDLIVIDGPAGPDGARFGTLPLIRPFVDGEAAFVLDDAFRMSELAIAQAWEKLSYVRLDGIRPIEKGLLIGALYGE